MAIMKRCLCFSNTRKGSYASGWYSLLYSVVYLAATAYQFYTIIMDIKETEYEGNEDDPIYAAYGMSLCLETGLIIASIMLLTGVKKRITCLFIPYMIAIIALTVLEAVSWIILLVQLGVINGFIFSAAVWALFLPLNIICFLCVLTYYQELSDQNTRSPDTPMAGVQPPA